MVCIKLIILFFIILLFSLLILLKKENFSNKGEKIHEYNGILVNNDSKRRKGLMFRKNKLSDNEGMLFEFTNKSIKSVWMKNTFIPLDLLFLNESNVIVDLHSYLKPHSLKSVGSKVPCSKFLEIDKDQIRKKNIKIGDKVVFKINNINSN